MALAGGEVDLVEVVDYAVNGIKYGAVGVIFAASVLVHEVVHGGVLEGRAAKFIARHARTIEAAACHIEVVRGVGSSDGNSKTDREYIAHHCF